MSKFRSLTGLGFIAAIVLAAPQFSYEAVAETCEKPVAVAVSVQGEVNARKGGAVYWEPVRRKDAFCPGDAVRVMAQSRADLLLINETTLRLDQNTEIVFTAPERNKEFWLDVLFGGTYFMSRTPRTFKVHTPFVNAGIEGTEFFIGVEKNRALLTVFEGRIAAANDRGEVAVSRGQSVVAEADRAPVLRIEARPRDAVRWTLFYPVVRVSRPGAPSGWQDRAINLLAVGRVDEASAEIEEALKTVPGNADALSLQAVIAVAQNEREKALDLAKKAVAAAPESATALVALSYAQQADFDLEGALASLREAVKKEPWNALARARLSELLLSFGRLEEALDEARKAAGQNPDIARTQTVLGFAYLAQIKTKESRDAFERAIILDQADPLPRLGLGLATIRDGDVEAGRKEIEIAASLDPNNSLIRSYLGKAYYEEKRGKTAATQFSMAKELDPNDPTPWFYDAILKQSVNRPVEALHDLQKSISLNDNRAVYRSRLLLDQDLAARSASLGRIYDDLGFQQLALVEGWKSVNTDPANYSAHRFLADSYSVLPGHEIARVSELLQSQLLQPINIDPIQPSLAQKNLLILEGAGPSSPSFNEFNPLFNRNRLALQASGVAGANSTVGGEAVQSAVAGNLSYSVGLFGFQTDGFRPNNDLDLHIFDAFAQASLSYKTSVQGEFRYTTRENGDLTLGFDPNVTLPGVSRQELEEKSWRLGAHHAFSPNSRIIASAIYEDNELVDTITDQIPGVYDLSLKDTFTDKVYSLEVQHLLSKERFGTVIGAGWIKVDKGHVSDIEVIFPPPIPPDVSSIPFDSDIQHINLYLYSQIHYPKNVTWTIGGSADFLNDTKDNYSDENQFNPKLGVVWTSLHGTTFRAAAFRVLTRTLVSTGQTIEPTQVAGFNQFFDDVGGTKSWRYGAAVDQKFSEAVYGGVEVSQRDLEVPIMFFTDPMAPPEFQWFDSRVRLGRAYLYWTPHRWVALSGEYQYEHIDNENEWIAGDYTNLKIQRVPLGLGFFHPSGIFFKLKETYFYQKGDFVSPLTFTVEPGSDSFWITDASIGYRLPKRLGLATIEGRNLFDQKFNYRDPDPGNPSLIPGRAVYFKITLSL
jgi:tetratricopeptide (TPR) repeat protein